jgi:uncharacterized protein with HEPN domain
MLRFGDDAAHTTMKLHILSDLHFTAGKQFTDYKENSMLRAAVERKFEIIGEALSKLSKADSAIASQIGEHARIIAFRNILIHGYAEIDDRLVWDI